MSTLKNGLRIDEATWSSPNYTAAGDVPAVYGIPRRITGVVVHHWGVTGQRFDDVANFLSRSGGNTSAHFVVEDGRVACLIDPANAAWHAGNAEGNATTIGIECRPEMTDGDLETLAQLIAWLEDTYGSLNIYRHKDWFNTACPGKYADKIDWLVNRVNAIHGGGSAPAPKSSGLIHLEPVTGYPISQNFGDGANLSSNTGIGHSGVDYACPPGTPAIALEAGTVLWADWAQKLPTSGWAARWFIGSRGFMGLPIDAGICLVIQHGTWISTYSHLDSTDLNIGDKVTQGQVVAKTGYTGYTYTRQTGYKYEQPAGAHLHFEALVDAQNYTTKFDARTKTGLIYGRVDPRPYFEQTVETGGVAALREDLQKEKDELSVLSEKVKNMLGGTTTLGDEVSWLPKNFQRVYEGISNVRLEIFNQKIKKQGETQPDGGMTTLGLEVSYMADNFKRLFNGQAQLAATLDRIEKRVVDIDARLKTLEGK